MAQLKDLVKPISDMTDDELLEQLRVMRHKRDVIRPAKVKHIERAETKVARKKVSSTEKLVANLSAEDKARLLRELTGG